MKIPTRRLVRNVSSLAVVALAAGLVAGCQSTPKSMVHKKQSKEYFPESEYGKASPRVSKLRTKLPRGGGRDQLGKPYKVRGKWYYPKEDKHYKKLGLASWYGDAFHGRLTANGEIYDMTHLTAAHPTMPLPSYAPRHQHRERQFGHRSRQRPRALCQRRIIDLSKRAAEMLDYTHHGHRQGEGRICRPRAARRPRRPVSDGVLPSRQPRAGPVRRLADRRHDRHERPDAERRCRRSAGAFPGRADRRQPSCRRPCAAGRLDRPAAAGIRADRAGTTGVDAPATRTWPSLRCPMRTSAVQRARALSPRSTDRL